MGVIDVKRSCMSLVAALALWSAPAIAQETLYQRLGGYDGIAAFTDGFIARLATDPSLGRFFVGHATSSGMEIRQHIVDFICAKSGGPCIYTGKSMLESHTGLKVTKEDWTTSLKLAVATMNELGVPAPVQKEVADFVGSLKPDIVGK